LCSSVSYEFNSTSWYEFKVVEINMHIWIPFDYIDVIFTRVYRVNSYFSIENQSEKNEVKNPNTELLPQLSYGTMCYSS